MNSLYFSNKLLLWYGQNMRSLPWRNTSNPYKIWVSEVILQQTRVNQGLSYYLRFIDKFPSVEALANANEEEVLKLWQGLGYYSRARNLLKGARQVVENYGGYFPATAKGLCEIKGIGEYTSAAIASIAFGECVAVVDGNVYRFLSRHFGITAPIDTAQGKNEFKTLANRLISTGNPGNFNQAIMEFGALECKPRNPNCSTCMFSNTCVAFKGNMVDQLPIKIKKTKVVNRYLNYLVLENLEYTYINKRTGNDVWRNLYDFPCIETLQEIELKELMATKEWKSLFGNHELKSALTHSRCKHVLTHQNLYIHFIKIGLNNEENFDFPFLKIKKSDIFGLPVPKIIADFLMDFH